jgi:hypothetical protein
MKGFALLLLLGRLALATPPLLVTSVGRVGLPPYEGTERIYRLEGTGCQTLRVGEVLVLQRQGERRSLGRLEVLSVHQDHAQARLSLAGDTFPLKGDLAIRTEQFLTLPEVPVAVQQPIPGLEALRPQTITHVLPRSVGQGAIYREPIYFIKGDASLSPGAQAKLKAWVATWGAEGQWSLECPQATAALSTLRTSALRSELQRLGIPSLEIQPLPEELSGRYDAIYVKKEPW